MKKLIFYLAFFLLSSQIIAQTTYKVASVGPLVFDVHEVILDDNFTLNDFCIYEYSTNYFEIFSRILNTSSKYCEWVNLRFTFFQNGSFVATDYSYIDLKTYNSTGILPYHVSLIETMINKVNFDSISFQIDYTIDDEVNDFMCDQILHLQQSIFTPFLSYYNWDGMVINESTYSVRYPDIFACFFKNNKMIYIAHTYLDIQNDTLRAGEFGYIDSFVSIPDEYDHIKYYLSYSINSLSGSGNICPNLATFTNNTYEASANENIPFEIFLSDFNRDQMEIMIDWGDGSIPVWEGPFFSNSTISIDHNFSNQDTFLVKAKVKDINDSVSNWSDSVKVTINSSVPVELTTFNAKVKYSNVILSWITISETNNYGFVVERKSDNENWKQIGFMLGNGTTTNTNYYNFTDLNIEIGELFYRLKQIDVDGTYKYSVPIKVTINVPKVFKLYQNYPNPFNSQTLISFDVPESADIIINIFNLKGVKVAEFFCGKKKAGRHTISWDALNISSGTYFIKIQSDKFTQIKKCTLIK